MQVLFGHHQLLHRLACETSLHETSDNTGDRCSYG